MNKWDIGQVVSAADYTEVAIKCNELQDRHIELVNGQYVVVANTVYEPTLQEQLIAKEREYGMSRWQREGILADDSDYSEYTKAKAQELEDLAQQIRNQNN